MAFCLRLLSTKDRRQQQSRAYLIAMSTPTAARTLKSARHAVPRGAAVRREVELKVHQSTNT